MASTYTYSLSSDFGGNLRISHLHLDVIAEAGITPTLTRIDMEGDNVDIVFDSALSAGEQTTLNNVVSAYTYVTPVNYDNTIKFNIKNRETSNTSYTREDTLIYEGSNNTGDIKKILAVGYMDSGVTNFSIKINDKTNNNIIAENSFTDTTESILELTPISNVPTERSILELQIKKTGGAGSKKCYVDSVTLYLE